MLSGLALPSTNLVLDFSARDDLDEDDEADLGEDVDLAFLRFCFLGPTVGVTSL